MVVLDTEVRGAACFVLSLFNIFLSDCHQLPCGKGSEQYAWLIADLSSCNRTRTPWVVLGGHRPMYYVSNNVSGSAAKWYAIQRTTV
jgi:hypothetical protein